MTPRNGRVVIVDDAEEERNTLLVDNLRERHHLDALQVTPEALTDEDLEQTQLLLIDFQLHEEWKQGPEHSQPAHRIKDGLALAAVLRRVLAQPQHRSSSPTAIALLTGHLIGVLNPLQGETRPHLVARFTNLEWAFSKSDSDLSSRIAALAHAVKQLPASWANDPLSRLMDLLGAPGGQVGECSVAESVLEALPPIHEIAEWSHGIAILRWLLHRILPYPTFLWSQVRLAVQLRVQPEWLNTALKTKLGELLSSARYSGVLSEFDGMRWWGRAIHQLLWDATDGMPYSKERLRAILTDWAGEAPQMLEQRDPVLAFNHELELTQVMDVSDATRVVPDDWPPFAEDAWASPEVLRENPQLSALPQEGATV